MRAVPRSLSTFSSPTAPISAVRHHEPADPQRRRQHLARGAGVDDAVGREALQRADRGAVVAVLGVVVVLDRDRAACPQPGEQRRPPLRRQHGAGRVLVRRRDDDRVGAGGRQRVDAQPAVVDRHGHGLEPGARDDQRAAPGRRAPRPPRGARPGGQREADDAEPLRVAAGDDDPPRLGDHAAHAAEVLREGRAQGVDAARVAVAEVGVGDRRQRLPQRAQPGGARERRDVRHAGPEVEARAPGRLVRVRLRRARGRGVGHARARALRQVQVALGRELGVGVDDDAPRDAELAGEVARRRHPRAGSQRPVADRAPHAVLDLGAERARAVAGDVEQQLYGLTGLVHGLETGSSACTSRS